MKLVVSCLTYEIKLEVFMKSFLNTSSCLTLVNIYIFFMFFIKHIKCNKEKSLRLNGKFRLIEIEIEIKIKILKI